jgi:hypothetical protein
LQSFWLSPQPLKPCRIGRCVHDGMLNVPVSNGVLNKPRVYALVGQGEAVPHHFVQCLDAGARPQRQERRRVRFPTLDNLVPFV